MFKNLTLSILTTSTLLLACSGSKVQTKRITIDGDLVGTEAQLAAYLQYLRSRDQQPVEQQTGYQPASLTIRKTPEGLYVMRTQPVKYSFDFARSKLDESKQTIIRTTLRTAMDDWEKICGVQFKEVKNSDKWDVVVYYGGENSRYARASFPDDLKHQDIEIDEPFFEDPATYSQVGILRHELGHTLGFVHEHLNATKDCTPDQGQRVAAELAAANEGQAAGIYKYGFTLTRLGVYDKKSVMHYPWMCGGGGNLTFSDIDIKAAQIVYGPPANAPVKSDVVAERR